MLSIGGCALSCVVEKNRAYYDIKRIAKKFTIYVIRYKSGNKHFQESQPCISCEVELKKMGFKKIIYSSEDGKIVKKKVSELSTSHYSKAQKVTNENVEAKKKRLYY